MARMIFEARDLADFLTYMEKFSGTERMILIHVRDDNSLILRPIVTSRLDTAIIIGLSEQQRNQVWDKFSGLKFSIKDFRDEEERAKR